MPVGVKLVKLHPGARFPEYATDGDAGADLFAIEDYFLCTGQRAIVGTGIALEIPRGYEGQIRPRSGLAAKHGVTVLNSPGTIDSGYRGEIKVILVNHGWDAIEIKAGERVAQLVIAPVTRARFILTDSLGDSDRGNGGFGSTGV